MQKLRFLVFLILISALIAGAAFLLNSKTEAFNGEPPCCMNVTGPYPNQLLTAFADRRPSKFKILGVMLTNLKEQTPFEVLAIIDKASITFLNGEKARLSLRVPMHVLNKENLKKGDYLILIPLSAYSNLVTEDMYDFAKIPRELLK